MEKKIPIEFLPGFWVSLPEGITGRGSGFLLAEHIQSVFSIDVQVPNSEDLGRKWSVIHLREDELKKYNYIEALNRIITESWLDTGSILILGNEWSIRKILLHFLMKTGGIRNDKTAAGIMVSKIN